MSASAVPVDPAASAVKARILVVDDDRLVLATVVHGLTAAGYDVIDADNGDDAILLARQHRPQLALLDIRMEGKSGFDVAETLRDAYGIPFMFLSAFADPDTMARVQSLGAQAYLVKPLEVNQIVPGVEAVLARLARQGAEPPARQVGAGAASPAAALPVRVHGSPPAHVDAPTSARADGWPAAGGDRASTTGERAAAAAAAVVAPPGPLGDPVALAVGVLMHRHSLSRSAALARLQQLAGGSGRALAAQAERLLGAVEELAATAR